MKPTASLLFLLPAFATAFSALDRPRAGFLHDVLEGSDHKYCTPTGLIQDTCCDFESVENVNKNLFNGLHDLVATPFFRFHKVDLYRDCPFWHEDGSCMNRACGVETTDEEHIPEEWRSKRLGELEKKAEGVQAPDALEGCDVDDSDFCVLEDEMDSEGLYVDLLQNPERFTGYAGDSSSRVWKAIYEENCFSPVPYIDASRSTSQGGSGFASLSMGKGLGALGGNLAGGAWGEREKRLMGSLAGPRDGGDEICLEKRVFYRLISGLHASISIHICDEYLDQTTGEWSPNLECFITRIGEHPERLQNAYFAYVVLLRALSKSGPQLLQTLAETSSEAATDSTKAKLEELIHIAHSCPSTFDETSMFSGPSSQILKHEFKEHFRNVSRIMDCVGCDKCRLWGKLQVTGLGTALKLLFSYDAPPPPSLGTSSIELDDPKLSRGEVVAFINTLHRLSESLMAVEKFRTLWSHRTAEVKSVELEVDEVDEVEEAIVSEVEEAVAEAIRREETADGDGSRVAETTKAPRSSEKAVVGEEEGLGSRLVRLCRESWRSCAELLREGQARWSSEL